MFWSCRSDHHSNTAAVPENIQDSSLNALDIDQLSDISVPPSTDSLVKEFISCFNPVNVDRIARKISYPLDRTYPIPDIQNEQEFHARFNEIFDDSLIKMIAVSNNAGDWQTMGVRGIMFRDGLLWLDEKGLCIALNYSGEAENKLRAQLIAKDGASLHPSIRSYQEPILLMQTRDYQIRIDRLGEDNFRMCSWPTGVALSHKPDLVIENGRREFQGSGGNHSYIFEKGAYSYICVIQILGQEDIPGDLTITRDGQELLVQDIQELHY